MSKYVLKEWSVVRSDNPYRPPEYKKLHGKVYGNPNFEDGGEITTSAIFTINKNEITTRSGSVYILEGEPSVEYMDWIKENNFTYNPEEPIRIINHPRKKNSTNKLLN